MFKWYLFVSLLIHLIKANDSGSSHNESTRSTLTFAKDEKYKILCWLPIPMKSHQRLVEPLLKELARRGHQVTFITPMPAPDSPANLHQITIQNHYHHITKAIGQGLSIKTMFMISRCIMNYMQGIFEDPTVQEFLNSDRTFDGIIMESMVMNEAFIGLHHKYKAPVTEIVPITNSHWTYFNLGIPYDTSYIVDLMTSFSDRMSFTERFHNTITSLLIRAAGSLFYGPESEELMNRYLRYPGWEDRPRLSEMLSNISLALINTHFSLSYPYPLPPHAKEIAGINIPSPQPLPKEYLEFMDSAPNGVIIFSLGSHLSMSDKLGPERIRIFTKFFSTLKQNVLWKWDGDDVPDVSSNVKITKWFPQTDVLAHKNCKLFISHCGFHSSIETVYYGVPVVAIPIHGDQTKNAKMLSYHGVGLILKLDNITEETLSWTVNQVLNNKIYRENALKRSLMYRDNQFTPLETAVYWIEYVLRHKGAHHLKPAVAWMPWYQQAMLDVYGAMSVVACTSTFILYLLLKCMFNLFLKNKLRCRENKVKKQ